LFDAGGHHRLPYTIEPPAYHGFRIFADRNNRWQARLSPDMLPVFSDPPLVPRSGRTYVALSVQKDGGGYKATVFVNGQLATTGRVGAYSRPDGAPLMIAIGNNASPDGPVAPRYPLIARVQEVVLYGKALSKEEVRTISRSIRTSRE
jgi:hypothetical protein